MFIGARSLGLWKEGRAIERKIVGMEIHLKRSIVGVKVEDNSLAKALLIAFARVINQPDYKACRKGGNILPKVCELLQATVFDLSRVGGIHELQAFQQHLSGYRIVVCSGL